MVSVHQVQPKCGHLLPPPRGLLPSALALETLELLEGWGTQQIFTGSRLRVPISACVKSCSFAPTQGH